MSKKPEAKAEKSKFKTIFSSLIYPIRNLKLQIKQTAPSGAKSKTKHFDTESGIVQERSKSINSKEDASDSIAEKKYSSLNETKYSKLHEDHVLQKYDTVENKSLKEHSKSRAISCLQNNKEVKAIVSVQMPITPITPENEVKLNNLDPEKSLSIQFESKNVSSFSNGSSIKAEPVDEYDDESEVSWKNKFKDSDRLLNGHSNHQNINCLEVRNIKDEETDKVDYKLESESEDENIIERAPDKIPKRKERHSEIPPRERHQETAVTTISQNEHSPTVIQLSNVHNELERIIAGITIGNHIAKLKDEEIKKFLHFHFGPANIFVPYADSISNPTINSRELGSEARYRLIISRYFSRAIFYEECLKMKAWIQGPEFDPKNKINIIHYLKLQGRRKYRRTNLHDAVINEDLEKTLCILEIHKWLFHNDPFDINAKDSSRPKKTALDCAYQTGNVLLIDYLRENFAERAVHINTPGT